MSVDDPGRGRVELRRPPVPAGPLGGGEPGAGTTEEAPFPELERGGIEAEAPAGPPRPAEGRGPLLVLAYLWLFALLPLAFEKEDAEVRWHARHGLVLAVAELLGFLAWGAAFLVVGVALPGAVPHMLLLGPWAGILVLWAHVLLAREALRGRRLRVPGLSRWADGPERGRA